MTMLCANLSEFTTTWCLEAAPLMSQDWRTSDEIICNISRVVIATINLHLRKNCWKGNSKTVAQIINDVNQYIEC